MSAHTHQPVVCKGCQHVDAGMPHGAVDHGCQLEGAPSLQGPPHPHVLVAVDEDHLHATGSMVVCLLAAAFPCCFGQT